MDLYVSLTGERNISGQIYRQLRVAIFDGRLIAGQALPATRELATDLKVSRNSVLAAYSRLSEEGIVISRVGAGSFVAPDIVVDPLEQRGQIDTPLRPRAFWRNFSETEYFDKAPAAFDFRTGSPDHSMFPFPTWRRLVMDELRASNRHTGEYGDPGGHFALRSAIAWHSSLTRGVRSAPGNITVTAGTQQALDLVARVFVERGDCVAVEEPGYPPVRQLLESYGARVTGVRIDDKGLDVTALPANARIVYLAPSHQYPMGISMPLDRRRAVLEWAEEHNAIVIEDDYGCDYRYGGRPVETLQSLDSSGRVLYIRSFSKTMLPSVRLGFIVAPSPLTPALHRAKFVGDLRCPLTTQSALANFIDSGLFDAHVRRMRQEYRLRREIILSTLRRDFSRWLTPLPSAAGLHVTTTCTEHDVNAIRLIQKSAASANVAIPCLADYFSELPGRPGLLFGFGATSTGNLREGLRRLHRCFTDE